MATNIKLKRSSVANKVPSTSDLALGELALNTNDGIVYFKKSVSSVDTVLALNPTKIANGTSNVAVNNDASVTLTVSGNATLTANASVVTSNLPMVSNIANVSAGTSATTVDQWPMATYRGAKYVATVSHATAGYQIDEILVVHDGVTASQVYYGTISTGAASLGDYSVTTSGGNVILQFTGTNSSNTVRVAPLYIPV